MPNLALMPYLAEFELHYIGRPNSMEEELVKKHFPHIIYHALDCVKLQRKLTLKNLLIPFILFSSIRKAKRILREIQPNVIFSKGGFVALPVMRASKGFPLILHESDYSMGLANRMGARKSTVVCTSFSSLAEKIKRGLHTGAPLRPEIYRGNKQIAERESGLHGRTNLLITGGSLGATALNEAVYSNLDELCKQFDIVHLVGKNNKKLITRPHYYQIPFSNNIADYFAWADLCITRGGANALFELVALKIPSLVVPLPKGISRGDQVDNANYFKALGCVKVLSQETITQDPTQLVKELTALRLEKNKFIENCKAQKNIDGTEKIVQTILSNIT